MDKNPILKHPWNYSAKELEELMFFPLRFHVGEIKSDKVIKLVDGQIVQIILASNPPHLPADVVIKMVDNSKVRYCIFELKGLSHI
ncbi:hypothetical protein [Algoriphagus sp. NG3]|uniref:hypothetical protein n=1 Tax=Algoriphagus sp. NG3 TaxID=3097546 RepID=UPI002A7FA939|nr:hypothetical protein [Algoriphagus sp. NG3]WPR77708.1 hypothetical protein SLW71_10170 [Algoriphagus sp. NG3]